MVTEQQLIEFMREKAYKPLNVHELRDALGITDGDELTELVLTLNRMEDHGLVVRTRTHCYGLPDKMNLVVGTLQGKSKGFGFVIPDDPRQQDVYIHAGDLAGALHGDRVIARVQRRSSGPRLEGAIIRILKRAVTTIVGTLAATEHYAIIRPDDARINIELLVPKEHLNGAKDGQKVVAEITHYPEEFRAPEGRIIEVLGNPDEPGVDILSVIRKYGLPEHFPDAVMDEADHVPDQISEEDIRGRRDLRDWKMVTIDGEDAKDLDDAVNVKRLTNGNMLLGVHIADVAYYVREGSALDKEAYNRGTSVYLVDRVIPMLPKRLSNGICSLNPQVDRLTLTCEMEWTPDGKRVRYDIYPSIIRTNERMTYQNVKRILVDRDHELMERYRDLVDDFILMEELAMTLRSQRIARGAIDFDFEEAKIMVDEKGKPLGIKKRERTIAEQIIEEFMLAANETVAEEFHQRAIPFLYRIHEQPDAEKIQSLGEFVHNFGYSLRLGTAPRAVGKENGRVEPTLDDVYQSARNEKASKKGSRGGSNASFMGSDKEISPKLLQQLLEQVKGTPEERVISTVTLRSMKQARYAAEALGHFGLSAQFYSHFTSPIRRYPDLQIHRIIREVVTGNGLQPDRLQRYREILGEVAQHASERERNAVDAERETDQLKKVEYMQDKIGEEFDGIISGVTQYGIFVELDNTVEGLIHVSYLADDYYHFNERAYALIGERTGRSFRIGDRVRIQVAGVNKEERQIDFVLLEGGYVRGEYVNRDASKGSYRKEVAKQRAESGNYRTSAEAGNFQKRSTAKGKNKKGNRNRNGRNLFFQDPSFVRVKEDDYETPNVKAQRGLGLPPDYAVTPSPMETDARERAGSKNRSQRSAGRGKKQSSRDTNRSRAGRSRTEATGAAIDGAKSVFGKVGNSKPVTAREESRRRTSTNEDPAYGHTDVYQPKRAGRGAAKKDTPFYDVFVKKKRR